MDTNALFAFVEVARQQSFSKAGDRLYLTQPAISKRIATLEKQLGLSLFDRMQIEISQSTILHVILQYSDCPRNYAHFSIKHICKGIVIQYPFYV